MSSNIRIKKICVCCGNEFTAKTFTTKYCSHKCNSKHYKLKVKQKRIEESEIEFKIEKTLKQIKVVSNLEELSKKSYLSIKEVCLLLNISESTIRKLIKEERLLTIRLGKKHIIKKSDIENMNTF